MGWWGDLAVGRIKEQLKRISCFLFLSLEEKPLWDSNKQKQARHLGRSHQWGSPVPCRVAGVSLADSTWLPLGLGRTTEPDLHSTAIV